MQNNIKSRRSTSTVLRSAPALFERLESRALFTATLPVVTDLQLVQATSGTPLDVLTDGTTVNTAQLGSFSVRADTIWLATSVVFALDGKTIQTETGAPYDIHGDTSGAPIAWAAPSGNHKLVVTPYLNAAAGTSIAVNFSITNSSTTTNPSPFAPPNGSSKLVGTLLGTPGSYGNTGDTLSNALDENTTTYFDAPTAKGGWVGYDLGSAYQITQVEFVPRSGLDSRMVGGIFQGSDRADFSADVTNLFTITTTPTDKVYTAHAVTTPGGFRYVRYLSPANGYCNAAEIEFDGLPGKTTPPVTTGFPTKVSWITGAPSPIVRAEAVGQTVNGKVYVFGGFNADGNVNKGFPLQHRCDVYNPATNKWTRLKDFPEPFTHSQGVVVGSDIWFVGAYVGNHPGPGTTHVWVYHTTNDSWTRGPDLPQARGAGAAALVGNTLYFSGGMNQKRTVDESTTYALDLSNQSKGWVQKANNPNARNHVAAASIGGYLYLLGGQHGQEEDQAAQSEVDRYNPATNIWTKMASLPGNAGKSHITEGTLVYQGRIIVVGGETGYNHTQRYIVDYDPATNKWTQLGLLPAARSTVVAGIVNGKLIVTTGNSPAPTTTTWIGTLL